MRITAWRRRGPVPDENPAGAPASGAAGEAPDETTAELEVAYWRAYHERMAALGGHYADLYALQAAQYEVPVPVPQPGDQPARLDEPDEADQARG